MFSNKTFKGKNTQIQSMLEEITNDEKTVKPIASRNVDKLANKYAEYL